jgi:ppGpp synthetase/RelA/SpoT-type nucleotidyltranferase
MRLLPLLFAAWLIPQPLAHATGTGHGCAEAALAVFDRGAHIDAAHVMPSERGGFDVLLPNADGSFEIAHTDSLIEGHLRVETRLKRLGTEPLDLNHLVTARMSAMNGIRPLLEEIRNQEPGALLTDRTKKPGSLREKIFRKVREEGSKFRLDRIDDLAGARFVVKDFAQMDRVVSKLRSVPGTEATVEQKSKSGGYRAVHVALRTGDGEVIEVQVMTERTSRWSTWDHDRVYKPQSPLSPEYRDALRGYGREIMEYLNSLDEGKPGTRPMPDADKHGIAESDRFPPGDLK